MDIKNFKMMVNLEEYYKLLDLGLVEVFDNNNRILTNEDVEISNENVEKITFEITEDISERGYPVLKMQDNAFLLESDSNIHTSVNLYGKNVLLFVLGLKNNNLINFPEFIKLFELIRKRYMVHKTIYNELEIKPYQ